MFPRLFHIGSYSQSTYGVLVALAFLVALSLIARLARRAGLNSDAVVNLGILCGLSAIVGAKIMMFLVDIPYYARNPGEIFSLASLQAGGVFYGGLIAALIAAVVYMRRHHLPALPTADVFAPGIALGHGIGRLGCFAAGCCWGRPTKLPWGVTFTNPLASNWWACRWASSCIPRSCTNRWPSSSSSASSTGGSAGSMQPGAIISLVPDPVFHRPLPGGVRAVSRAAQSFRRPAEHFAVDLVGAGRAGRRVVRA